MATTDFSKTLKDLYTATRKVKEVVADSGTFLAVQVLHVGPYDQVVQTYRQLHAYAAEHGLAVAGPAREIYLSDPRRVPPEKLKTIVRLPVKKAG